MYIQPTMGLFFNPKLVGNIYKANKKMCFQSNGGKIFIYYKAQVSGYKTHFLFDQIYITNLISHKNSIKQYHVT